MFKKIIILTVALTMIVFVFSGCVEEKNSTEKNTNIFNWDAQRLSNDLKMSSKMSGGVMKWKIYFETLDEGDKVIIADEISNISYTQYLYNTTRISFDVDQYKTIGMNTSQISFLFDGDLTSKYNVGDTVKINFTVKNIEIINDTSGTNIEIEGYLEGSEPKGLFSMTQTLPETCIKKV